MPSREKILVSVLAAIFVISFGRFLIENARFPIYNETGVFSEGFVGQIRNINPLFVDFNDTDRDISKLIFSGLIKYDPLQKNFLPDLAEKWERSSNGLVYKFILRPNIFWHHETPVTAEDVVFTFKDVIQNPEFRNPILKNTFEGIEITTTPANEIIFKLQRSNSYFISNLTVGLLPKHLQNSNNKLPIGTGPYKVTSFDLDSDGDELNLESFSKYYGPKPSIEKMRIFTFPNEKSLIQQKDSLHAVGKLNLANEMTKLVANDPRFTPYTYTLNQFTALHFNINNSFLNEQKFRKAIALTLNKQTLIKDGEKRIDALDLEDHSNEAKFKTDIETAKKLLSEIKFPPDPEKTFVLLTMSKMPQDMLDGIRSQLQEIGIKIEIKKLELQEFYKYVSERNYDMLLIRHNLGYNRDIYPILHSSQMGSNGLNFSNFKSFKTDGLTEAIRKEKNPPDKEKLLIQLNSVIEEEIPFLFISTPIYLYALDKNISPSKFINLDFHSDRFSIIPYLK